MNLLLDKFISTQYGKVSLKDILTTDTDYQLQYFFDETQLSMLQMLSSLTTVLFEPSLDELATYLEHGIEPDQFDNALEKIDLSPFKYSTFLQLTLLPTDKTYYAPISKLVSGIETGTSANACGLFSEPSKVENVCSDCVHVLNYNLHMNIKGECFSSTGATGIRGGGALTTLIHAKNLKKTILLNTIAVDAFYEKESAIKSSPNDEYMWESPPSGDIYYAHDIGLKRGLFALAYRISFEEEKQACSCDICGHQTQTKVSIFSRQKLTGSYGSKKEGRDASAGWWPHPFTPIKVSQNGVFPISATDQNFRSWQDLSSFIVGTETDKHSIQAAYVVTQLSKLSTSSANLMVGGNIANQGSIVGRVYDLYSLPSSIENRHIRLSSIVSEGLKQKDNLDSSLKILFGLNYDKNFAKGIKDNVINKFISDCQPIIMRVLQNVNRKEARELREETFAQCAALARMLMSGLLKKYQHNHHVFKALVKAEKQLLLTQSKGE